MNSARVSTMMTTTIMTTTTTVGLSETIFRLMFVLDVTFRISMNCIKSPNGSAYYDYYDMKRVNNDCFVLIYKEMDLGDAVEFCQEITGHMADIVQETEEHLENITLANGQENKDFWIGLIYFKGLDRWIWINGNRFNYKDRFDNDMYGNCVVWKMEKRKWENIDCYSKRPFICKIPMSEDCSGKGQNMTLVTTPILPVNSNVTVTVDPRWVNFTSWTDNYTTDAINTTVTTFNTTEGERTTTDVPVQPQAQNAGFSGMLHLLVALSTLLAVSMAVNLFFFVQFVCQCRRRSRMKESMLPLDDLTMTSPNVTQMLYNDNSSSPPAITVTESQPIYKNHRDDHDDQIDHYVAMESPTAKNSIGMQGFQGTASSKPGSEDDIDDIVMIPNVVYNKEMEDYTNTSDVDNVRVQLNSEYYVAKAASSDKDNVYDVPVSPLKDRHYSLEVLTRPSNNSFNDRDIYHNEIISIQNKKEEFSTDQGGDNPIIQDDGSCHECPYENTEF